MSCCMIVLTTKFIYIFIYYTILVDRIPENIISWAAATQGNVY